MILIIVIHYVHGVTIASAITTKSHSSVQNISDESDEEKSRNIYQIQTLYAFDLFNNKQFHESMKEFLKLGTGEMLTS
jgi:hypothetical protein